jgi:hypothetical protein
MATVIDSLIVTLGLDNKDFLKGIKLTDKELEDLSKKQAEQDKKDKERKKELERAIDGTKRAAIRFLAVMTAGAGLVSFTKNVVSTGANLSRLSFSGILFLGNLLLILVIFTAFFIEVKLIPTLCLLLFISPLSLFLGFRALAQADCTVGDFRHPQAA